MHYYNMIDVKDFKEYPLVNINKLTNTNSNKSNPIYLGDIIYTDKLYTFCVNLSTIIIDYYKVLVADIEYIYKKLEDKVGFPFITYKKTGLDITDYQFHIDNRLYNSYSPATITELLNLKHIYKTILEIKNENNPINICYIKEFKNFIERNGSRYLKIFDIDKFSKKYSDNILAQQYVAYFNEIQNKKEFLINCMSVLFTNNIPTPIKEIINNNIDWTKLVKENQIPNLEEISNHAYAFISIALAFGFNPKCEGLELSKIDRTSDILSAILHHYMQFSKHIGEQLTVELSDKIKEYIQEEEKKEEKIKEFNVWIDAYKFLNHLRETFAIKQLIG